MDTRLNSAFWTLRIAFGLMAFLAGLDKFLNLLTNWEQYVSPLVLSVLPLSAGALMHVAGVIEIAAGIAILIGITRLGGYVVAGWLTMIALTLVTTGHYFDVAVRDLVMACGAFVLGRLSEVREHDAATTKRGVSTGMLAAAVVAGVVLAAPATAMEQTKAGEMSRTSSAVELRTAMRQLWEEHIVYTRNFIISALADLGDTDKVAERLLRNQDDIGNAIKPFYGDEARKKLAALLRDHILIAADIVKAAKTGNNDGVANGEKRWHANGDEISAFLSAANPNWPKADLTDMLYKHLDFTTTEVVSRIKKDWPADIEAYDKGHAHMLMFADALTNGIVKQFPKKFVK
jgi:uncharacterized membrane protein YphA (DoxX/SURF4 family)